MQSHSVFYINGKWTAPATKNEFNLINPATELPYAKITMGSSADVDAAVQAARHAFKSWRSTSLGERINLLQRLKDIYQKRFEEMAKAISTEMGAPISMARDEHTALGLAHIQNFIEEIGKFQFQHTLNNDPGQQIVYSPIGVCGLITPWNWPINQLTLKVIPALATGCCVVLKPSEIAPLSAILLTEMIDEAGYPPGVFNLINGDGPSVGHAITAHPGVDLISFTGSTTAGIAVMKSSADTVKKVTLELGGKSPNIIFADADLEQAVMAGAGSCFSNTGQTCVAPTRMLVERSVYKQAVARAVNKANQTQVSDPTQEGGHIGPLSSLAQFEKVQSMIQKGIDEGATLVAGGLGRPDGIDKGYFVRPTVFADVDNSMMIAREEIFGPVLVMIPFDDEQQAVNIANDTPFGLNARVQTTDIEKARRVAAMLDAGMVQINGASPAPGTPFGGHKQSGIGREGGRWGIEDYLEVKAISGWEKAA